MNFLPRALCVFLLAASAASAQRISDPNLDDYVPTVEDELVIYVPKNAVRVGFRALSGASAGFSGQGVISSKSVLGSDSGVQERIYHDGAVGLDQRKVADPSGVLVPITPDGYTNNWTFAEQSQAEAEPGFIAMHAYTATITDTALRNKDPGTALGIEVSTEREMGSLFNSRLKWGLVGGVSVNQILSEMKANVTADVETITDFYSLDGQAAPTAPYTAPTATLGVDNSVLLRSQLLQRLRSTAASEVAVENRWKLRGAYLTLRAGPTLLLPITSRFSASVSVGGVLVYAGTSFEVEQSFTPETGDTLVESVASNDYALLPGYYVDANLQYDFTDNAGLYLGAIYQSSGSYDHQVSSSDELSNYKARVDLASLQGIRAGMTFKF
ncbi:MAG TPA: hypothetical protein VNR00_19520 [Opitutus sp.]|nr:hypothetical protein [Opitutus sp.]